MVDLQGKLDALGYDLTVERTEGDIAYVSHEYTLEEDRAFASEILKALSNTTKETGFRFSIYRRQEVA